MISGSTQFSSKMINISSAFMFRQNVSLILLSNPPKIPERSNLLKVHSREGRSAKPATQTHMLISVLGSHQDGLRVRECSKKKSFRVLPRPVENPVFK